MPKRLKKLSEEVLHKNPYSEYKHDTFEKPNGETGDYYYLEFKGMAMVVPVLPDGRIVLTLQHRYLTDKQSIEFPGGGLENMDAAEAAKRELREETGYEVEELMKRGMFESGSGTVKDTTHVFLAYVNEHGQQELDDTEDIEILYRRPDEVEDMIVKNEIWCGQTIAAWMLVRDEFFKT